MLCFDESLLVKFADVYLNLSIDNPDCRTMDRKVPIGISLSSVREQ
jgi:hypothetical protein